MSSVNDRIFAILLLLEVSVAVLFFAGATNTATLILEAGATGLAFAYGALALFNNVPFRSSTNPATILLTAFVLCNLIRLFLHATSQTFGTYAECILATSYLCVFVLSVELIPKQERLIAMALAVFGSLFALFSLLQLVFGNGNIYGLYAAPYAPELIFGSYFNRDHYAAAIEMLLPFAAVKALDQKLPSHVRAWCAIGACLSVASVVACHSRAGFLCISLELFILVATASLRRKTKWLTTLSIAGLLLCFLAVDAWHSQESLSQRVLQVDTRTDLQQGRLIMYRDGLRMISDRPLWGFGLGTFRSVYPHYKSLPSPLRVEYLHNDWLQLFVENGLLGSLPFLCFLGVIACRALRREYSSSSFNSAARIGLIAIAFHCLVDFNLHVPANALLFFMLSGGIVAHPEGSTATSTSNQVFSVRGARRSVLDKGWET